MTDETAPVVGDSTTTPAPSDSGATSDEQTQNALSEGAEGEAPEGNESPDGKAEPDKSDTGKPSPEQRKAAGQLIRELKKQARESKAKVEFLQSQIDRLTKPTQEVDTSSLSLDDQEAARLEKAVRKVSVTQTQHDAEAAQKAATSQVMEAYKAICDEVADRAPGLFEKLTDPKFHFSEFMADEVLESDKAAELVMHLVNNPTEAREIAKLPPHRQGAAIARIEARLQTASQVRKVSSTPPPTGSLKGSGAASVKDPSRMSYADYVKWRESQQDD